MTQEKVEISLPMVEYSAGAEVTLARLALEFFEDEKTRIAFERWQEKRKE